ncbi:ABC transporter ATP-binding protein [Halovivax gelatinilyticus]|uniref:ABC transporter ATP-binding protein n=1 Tax=Halovivax gelatinilyticus TaxID=2961597 RepID=UPI0020CA7B28|nr:oligopeptide/dipeptide ABC transporter ATP-binding protein [Halovivax gelatinilyticus]
MSNADEAVRFENETDATDARADETTSGGEEEVLVEVDGLSKFFSNDDTPFDSLEVDLSNLRKPVQFNPSEVKAVDDVSFDIRRGETLGLVGESGCGKSTLARALLNLIPPSEGSVTFNGTDLSALSGEELRRQRKDVQMVFQDPQSSLNPRMKVGQIIEAPMKAHGMLTKSKRKERTVDLLERVGLEPSHYNRYPHEFSGGQRQRVNLARAIAVDPEFIVCDEPVSALDVSIQARILNTMKRLQSEFGLTYLFITHDLSVLRYIADRVAVMYLGKIVEVAETDELFDNPQHPYTKSLLQALPIPDPDRSGERVVLEGEVPSPTNPPSGCRFRTRCPELICPDEFELSDEQWDSVRTYVRAVRRQRIDPTYSRGDIEAEYFGDVSLPSDVNAILQQTLDEIEEDDWETAKETVATRIEAKSICAREFPEYELEAKFGSDRHFCSCHAVAPQRIESAPER